MRQKRVSREGVGRGRPSLVIERDGLTRKYYKNFLRLESKDRFDDNEYQTIVKARASKKGGFSKVVEGGSPISTPEGKKLDKAVASCAWNYKNEFKVYPDTIDILEIYYVKIIPFRSLQTGKFLPIEDVLKTMVPKKIRKKQERKKMQKIVLKKQRLDEIEQKLDELKQEQKKLKREIKKLEK